MQKIIGKTEFISFPSFNILNIAAKVDTGAYFLALHCSYIEEKIVNNKKVLVFKLLDPSHRNYSEQENVSDSYFTKIIKNSFGETEKRYCIKTQIVIANHKILVTATLSNRHNMKYPVLIGRRILKMRFLVDVSQEFIFKEYRNKK
jgi:hypothetical protein